MVSGNASTNGPAETSASWIRAQAPAGPAVAAGLALAAGSRAVPTGSGGQDGSAGPSWATTESASIPQVRTASRPARRTLGDIGLPLRWDVRPLTVVAESIRRWPRE